LTTMLLTFLLLRLERVLKFVGFLMNVLVVVVGSFVSL
jgi:hypothetical protein